MKRNNNELYVHNYNCVVKYWSNRKLYTIYYAYVLFNQWSKSTIYKVTAFTSMTRQSINIFWLIAPACETCVWSFNMWIIHKQQQVMPYGIYTKFLSWLLYTIWYTTWFLSFFSLSLSRNPWKLRKLT